MSAILRLTQESIVLEDGSLILRAPTPEAVDFYLAKGFTETGERIWSPDEIPAEAAPFRPIALRLLDPQGQPSNIVRSVEPITVELEYGLNEAIPGLRVGIYLMTARGEHLLASFDTDDPQRFEQFGVREAGHYTSRCRLPADLLNEGRFILGMNASSYRIKRYFMEERSLTFTVEGIGAPGSQWTERRPGPINPRLDWQILLTDARMPVTAGGPGETHASQAVGHDAE
jgi:lipopolysaccharide transport system ATP-binding protein